MNAIIPKIFESKTLFLSFAKTSINLLPTGNSKPVIPSSVQRVNPGSIKERLMALQLRFEMDEIDEEEYDKKEDELFKLLENIRTEKQNKQRNLSKFINVKKGGTNERF